MYKYFIILFHLLSQEIQLLLSFRRAGKNTKPFGVDSLRSYWGAKEFVPQRLKSLMRFRDGNALISVSAHHVVDQWAEFRYQEYNILESITMRKDWSPEKAPQTYVEQNQQHRSRLIDIRCKWIVRLLQIQLRSFMETAGIDIGEVRSRIWFKSTRVSKVNEAISDREPWFKVFSCLYICLFDTKEVHQNILLGDILRPRE